VCACVCNLPCPQDRNNFEEAYQSDLDKYNISRDVGEHFASFTYDAVWAIGVALNGVVNRDMSLANFSSNNTVLADILTEEMEKVEFQGISVRCLFSIHLITVHRRVTSSLRMEQETGLDTVPYISTMHQIMSQILN